MAQFTVRNLEEDVKQRLKKRAIRHGTSLEDEVRQILRNAVKDEVRAKAGLGSRISARFAVDSLTSELPELHGEGAKPADFNA
ncbi:FitA-like ribbon-helix-helix domain-containing protein [Nevskia soli]|uniref:FitA-like ribbon-helix-helix domain-containing protein n=1 Tax=Nevskia soli TaxID=418856 RepID=UPI0004A6EDB3|nr:Arc family DNA-binding protein [Nevskia soli]